VAPPNDLIDFDAPLLGLFVASKFHVFVAKDISFVVPCIFSFTIVL